VGHDKADNAGIAELGAPMLGGVDLPILLNRKGTLVIIMW